MATTAKRRATSQAEQRALLTLSPFELKDKLIALAAESARESAVQMLNAGRGNPNWICTTPREAFGTLLAFGIDESRRGPILPDLGRTPEKEGIGGRFVTFLETNSAAPGTK
ncbi:MAG: aspartate 4-decarboxylase, partial [Gaiellaceae bacterium]